MILFLFLLINFVNSFKINTSFMRHGPTYNNLNKIWTGELDIDLFYEDDIIYNNRFDLILSSTQKRCRQTVNNLIFSKVPDIIYNENFNECGYGSLTGLKKDYSVFERKLFNKPPKSDLYKSESIVEGGLRAYNAYNKLLSDYVEMVKKDEYNVLVLSHKNTLKGLWGFLSYEDYILDLEEVDPLKFKNNFIESIKLNPFPEFDNLEIYNLTD